MKYTSLGRTGMEVSRICLGTMNFGAVTEEADARRMMDVALDLGITFFDTANTYNGGRTEEIIGRWFAQGGGRRDQVILATKVWSPFEEKPNRSFGLSAYKIARQVEESLRRLRTDRIELYQMHYVDRSVGWDEKLGAFENLVRQGKVDYMGSSNHAAWDLAQAQGHARQRGFLGIVSEQHHYNLLSRDAEREVIPCCRAHGIGLITYGPVGGGLLGGRAGKAAKGTRSDSDHIRSMLAKHGPAIDAYLALCEELGESPAAVAVAWLLGRPGLTAPIVGPRTVDQVRDAARAVEIQLSPDTMSRLDAIFPPAGQYIGDIRSKMIDAGDRGT